MGRAGGMADALRRLELDLARHQDWIARFAADFVRRHPFCSRGNRSSGRIDGTRPPVTATRLGLRGVGSYRRPYVRCELRAAFLGRTARLIGSGGGVAGDNPDLRHGVRPSDAS